MTTNLAIHSDKRVSTSGKNADDSTLRAENDNFRVIEFDDADLPGQVLFVYLCRVLAVALEFAPIQISFARQAILSAAKQRAGFSSFLKPSFGPMVSREFFEQVFSHCTYLCGIV